MANFKYICVFQPMAALFADSLDADLRSLNDIYADRNDKE